MLQNMSNLSQLKSDLSDCTLCRTRFAATATSHRPRPVVWFDAGARILVAGQAPGIRVHQDGRPFWDRSGDRLREWMGIDKDVFYDKKKLAIVPMAFCFPGYNTAGSDLAPPTVCASTWRKPIIEALKNIKLTLLIGGYAQKWHLETATSVTKTVANWHSHLPHTIPLPHPSWRNTAWLKKNPWFSAELLPVLRKRVAEELK